MANIKEQIKNYGTKRLADELGVTTGAVSQWRDVPVGRVLEVERLLGIPRHQIRPDIYPAPSDQHGASV